MEGRRHPDEIAETSSHGARITDGRIRNRTRIARFLEEWQNGHGLTLLYLDPDGIAAASHRAGTDSATAEHGLTL